MFSSVLLTSNHMIFSCNMDFQRLQILLVFETFTRPYLFQIALEIMWLPILVL